MAEPKISARRFYAQFHGHPVDDLEILLPRLRESAGRLIWLAGDSSLDNKYWFNHSKPAVGVYKEVLRPPDSNADVNYWINRQCEQQGRDLAAINTAVEATTLNARTFRLRSQDKFLRENIGPDDILVVSVGANDVALMPCPCTIASILCQLLLPIECTERGFSWGTVPADDCCCGCGPSLASCACACPPCLGYLQHLFGTRVEKYIQSLTKKQKPKIILVCMVYFPGEATAPSWAAGSLAALGYNQNPAKLQAVIRKIFVHGTSNIRIPGSQVVPVALFNVLDGKSHEDYMSRVEPSPIGGQKMADYILRIIDQAEMSGVPGEADRLHNSSSAPTTSYMGDRM